MTRRQRTIARILFGVYLVAVAWLCFGKLDSSQNMPTTLWGIPTDKIAHFLMFLPFPVLAFFAFDRFTERFWPSVLWTVVTFLAGSAFAAGTEYVQARLLPYRTGDPADFKADLLALAASSVIVLILDLSKQKK
jgi:VanZ family protein